MDELQALRERKKELDCLYRVQELLFHRELPLFEVLQAVVELVGEGWQRPETTGASIEYFGHRYQSTRYQPGAPCLTEPLYLGDLPIGSFTVTDSSTEARQDPAKAFFLEEQKLLNSLASLVSEFLERRQLTLLGPGFAPQSPQHWLWQERIAQRLVERFDSQKFGPTEFYLGESGQPAESEAGNNINLGVYHQGTAAQRVALGEWLNGWSVAVGDIAAQQTGEHQPEGIINLVWFHSRPDLTRHPDMRRLRSDGKIHAKATPLQEPDPQIQDMVQRTLMGLSHELRNPLTVISADLGLLKENLAPEEVAEIVAEIENATSRMSILVTDLMLFLRAETSTTRPPMEEVNLSNFLTRYESEYRAKSGSSKVRFQPARVADDPLLTQLNLKMTWRILTELIRNAVNYSSASNVEVSTYRSPDGRVVLSVVDDGCGIDEVHHDKLFEQFYRIDTGRDRSTGGVGLGLPLARAFARSQNADLELLSRRGEGTEVRVLFLPPNPEE